MRDVNYGWLLRYLHANGASFFFLAVYIHMARGMYYGSYKEPREVLWILGVILFLLMVATGFMGYVLPWGQMSFWAATVITNLFSAMPRRRRPDRHLAVGRLRGRQSDAQSLLFAALPAAVRHRRRRGAAYLGAAYGRAEQSDRRRAEDREGHRRVHALCDRQGRFFIAPVLHLLRLVHLLHSELSRPFRQLHHGQSRPDADAYRSGMVLPAVLRHSARDPEQAARRHRALAGSIVILAFLPWLDTSRVRSANYRPLYRQFLLIFFAAVIGLGYLGSQPPEGGYVIAARILTIYYFAFFLIILPLLGLFETTKPLPNSISESVLRDGVPIGASAPPPSGARS